MDHKTAKYTKCLQAVIVKVDFAHWSVPGLSEATRIFSGQDRSWYRIPLSLWAGEWDWSESTVVQSSLLTSRSSGWWGGHTMSEMHSMAFPEVLVWHSRNLGPYNATDGKTVGSQERRSCECSKTGWFLLLTDSGLVQETDVGCFILVLLYFWDFGFKNHSFFIIKLLFFFFSRCWKSFCLGQTELSRSIHIVFCHCSITSVQVPQKSLFQSK